MIAVSISFGTSTVTLNIPTHPMRSYVGPRAIEFHDEHTAFAVRAELAKMQKEYLIDMKDVVVVTKDEKGKVKLHQAANLTMAGAVSGSFWGMLIGVLFLNPLMGAAVGAGAGALSGSSPTSGSTTTS